MADPITWGFLNLIKKRVKGVQTTLDGVSDKISGLPDSLDTDFTEVKNAISDVKTDVGNVNTAVGGVKEDTTSIKNTVDTNSLLAAGSAVKSVQRGTVQITSDREGNGTLVATISPVNIQKSLLIVNYTYTASVTSSSSAYLLSDNSIYLKSRTDSPSQSVFLSWQVIEFY